MQWYLLLALRASGLVLCRAMIVKSECLSQLGIEYVVRQVTYTYIIEEILGSRVSKAMLVFISTAYDDTLNIVPYNPHNIITGVCTVSLFARNCVSCFLKHYLAKKILFQHELELLTELLSYPVFKEH